MAESDRELRTRLETVQHEVRGLQHELTVDASPSFVEKRAALQAELPPLKKRVDELEALARESAGTLATAQNGVATLERSLREVEQRNLSMVLALISVGVVSIAAQWAGSLSMELLAGVSGLGLGWLLSSRNLAAVAPVPEEEEAVALSTPRELFSIVVPLAMLVLSPVMMSALPKAHEFSDFPRVVRLCGLPLFVVLGGLACRLGRRNALLACAMVVAGFFAGLTGRLALQHGVTPAFANEWVALIIGCFSLPVILLGQWRAAATRRQQVWRVFAGSLLAGSAWSTWWLMTTFLQDEYVPFTSFAGFGLELSIAAAFFMFDSPRGRARSVLLALSGLLSAWVVLIYATLYSIRLS